MTSVTMKVAFRTARRLQPAPPPAPKPIGQTPIARRIALAHHIEALIDAGEIEDYADAARRLGLSRARITQVADLALLAPDIQEAVLQGRCEPRDRHLREVGRHPLWTDQRRAFLAMFPHVTLESQHD
jgi:ParB-like chromosome segregation protein Spo0J